MSKLLISVKDAAAEDIEEAFLWYENQSFGSGNGFKAELKLFINKISSYPFSYSFVKQLEPIRKLRMKHFSYYIYYIVTNNSIDILGIIHTSRSDQFIHNRLL